MGRGGGSGRSSRSGRAGGVRSGTVLGGQLDGLQMVSAAPGHTVVVMADVAKLDAQFQQNPNFAIGRNGQGGIGSRYQEAKQFIDSRVAKGQPVNMPQVAIDASGRVSFSDGRHRFAVLRDSGARVVPVSVDRSDAAKVRKLVGQ